MTDAVEAEIRDALISCADAVGPAQGALHPLTMKPERPRWWAFLNPNPMTLVRNWQQWQESQPSALVYELAADEAQTFHESLHRLLAVFPDEPLRRVAGTSSTWRKRIWTADETVDLIAISLEIDGAAAIVNELYAELNRGRPLRPRDA